MCLQGGLPQSKKGICAHSHADGPASSSSIQLWSGISSVYLFGSSYICIWDTGQSEQLIFLPNYARYRVMFTGGGSPDAVGICMLALLE